MSNLFYIALSTVIRCYKFGSFKIFLEARGALPCPLCTVVAGNGGMSTINHFLKGLQDHWKNMLIQFDAWT